MVLPDANDTGIWYTAADAAGGGSGLIDSPLTWTEAAQSKKILPGHEIVLRGGVHDPGVRKLNFTVESTEADPVIIRNHPGEVAIIRGGVDLLVDWAPTFISEDYGLLFQDVITNRTNTEGTGAPPGTQTTGIGSQIASGLRIINVRFDNTVGTCITWFNGDGGEIYGVIGFNNGWFGTDGWHGPGTYFAKGDPDVAKLYAACVWLNTARAALQVGEGGGNEHVRNLTIEDVTAAATGVFTGSSYGDGIVFDGLWMSGGTYNLVLGFYYTGANGSVQVVDSIVDAPLQFTARNWSDLDVQLNKFSASSYSNVEVEGGVYVVANNEVVTSGVYTQVIPNTYATGFGILRFFNFDASPSTSITVDVSALIAGSGTLRVRNPMLWDTEYEDLTVTDGEITLPTNTWTTPAPNGFDEPKQQVFSTRFGVFVAQVLD